MAAVMHQIHIMPVSLCKALVVFFYREDFVISAVMPLMLNYDHGDDNSYHLSRAYQVAGTGLGFYLCCGDSSH